MHRRHAVASFIALLVAAGFAAAVGAQQKPVTTPAEPKAQAASGGAFEIDAVHSSVIFRVKHMGVSDFIGRFNDINGSITTAADGSPTVKVSIPVASIDTNNQNRDTHLKGEEFFHADKFADMTFSSTAVKPGTGGSLDMTGDFTMHGVTKSITASLVKVGEKDGGERFGYRAGWTCEFTIKRSEFGMGYGVEQGMLGDDVHITICIEAVKK